MKLQTVSRYNPGNCEPALLERLLVARKRLLSSIEHDIDDAVTSGAGHQWLLVGPRGAGKTHLIAVLHHRLSTSGALAGRIVIAYLKEEERRVSSFLDWMVAILRALAADEPEADLDSWLGALMELPLARAEERAVELVLAHVGERRLVVLTENLGQTFARLGTSGQRSFRDVIQQHPRWTIIATAQSVSPDIQDHGAPFYGFFKVRHLAMLSLDEAVDLIDRLAVESERLDLRRELRRPVGRARIRAIHELSNGNPRLLVIFFQLLERSSVAQLADAFLEMVEELTAYYQEQRARLAPVQDKIVDFLCDHRTPVAVKEIARQCFLSPQTASKELEKLREKRFVVRTKVGRESHYELREPLLRVSSEIKANRGYPIRLFVDFIGRYYTVEELSRKHRVVGLLASLSDAGGRGSLDIERVYILEAARQHYGVELAPLARAADLGTELRALLAERAYDDVVRVADVALERLPDDADVLTGTARAHRATGALDRSLELAVRATRNAPEDADAWVERGSVEYDLGRLDAAAASFDEALGAEPEHGEALVLRGLVLARQGHPAEARAYAERATRAVPDNAAGWRLLAQTAMELGDSEDALLAVGEAKRLDPESAGTWRVSGLVSSQLERYREAEEDLRRAIELDPTEGQSHRLLGRVYLHEGDNARAVACFRRATEVEPDLESAWTLLALAEVSRGRPRAARAVLERALQDREMPSLRQLLALVLVSEGELDTAVEVASHFDSVPTALAAALGYLLQLAGRSAEALPLLREVAARGGERSDLRAALVAAEIGSGASDEEVLALAARMFDRPPEAFWPLALVAVSKTNRWPLLKAVAERVTHEFPDAGEAWRALALVAGKLGDGGTARLALERAVDVGPYDAATEYALGRLLQDGGDLDGAIARYRSGAKRAPEFAPPWFNIVLAGFLAGRVEEAFASLEEALTVEAGRRFDSDDVTQALHELGAQLLLQSSASRVRERLVRFWNAVRRSRHAALLPLGMTGAVLDVLAWGTAERLRIVHDALVATTGEEPDYEVLRRWTDVAARYRESADIRVLLELPLEERRKLAEILGEAGD